jgi:uncharacterized coiled-coil protein SlyX
VAKIEDYTKTITVLRTKATANEETIADLKGTVAEKEKEAVRLREKVGQL